MAEAELQADGDAEIKSMLARLNAILDEFPGEKIPADADAELVGIIDRLHAIRQREKAD